MTAIDLPAVAATASFGALRRGLTAVGAIAAVNAAVLGSQLFFDSRNYSDVVPETGHLVHYTVWCIWLIALSQLFPRMGRLRGATGQGFPAWVLVLAGVGAAADACARFVNAFVLPALVEEAPRLVDEPPAAVLLVPLLGVGVIWMVGAVALAVVAFRRRIFPRPAAVLLGVAGVSIPVVGPLSAVLLGVALVWCARAIRD